MFLFDTRLGIFLSKTFSLIIRFPLFHFQTMPFLSFWLTAFKHLCTYVSLHVYYFLHMFFTKRQNIGDLTASGNQIAA